MRRQSSDGSARSRLALAACLLACGLAFVLACGSGEQATSPAPAAAPSEPAPADATAAPGEAAPPAAAMPEEGGEAIAEDGVIPQGYPTDVPVYPGAKPGSSMSMPGLGVFATFESADDAGKILEHYRAELSKGGWSVTDTADGGGIDATKDQRSLQVRARATEEGSSEIAVNVSEG